MNDISVAKRPELSRQIISHVSRVSLDVLLVFYLFYYKINRGYVLIWLNVLSLILKDLLNASLVKMVVNATGLAKLVLHAQPCSTT